MNIFALFQYCTRNVKCGLRFPAGNEKERGIRSIHKNRTAEYWKKVAEYELRFYIS